MLLQFTAENFRSISDEVELSMRASDEVPGGDSERARAVVAKPLGDLEVLRCAAIYGANASGKSNLVEAMLVARQLVVHGTSSRGTRLGAQAFRLDTERRTQPSRFEFYVLIDNEIYGYGFAATDKLVVEESLTVLVAGEEVELFSRRDGHIHLAAPLVAEQEDPKFVEYVARGTPDNQLFLHEAQLRNIESKPMDAVFRWFEAHLKIIKPATKFTQLVDLADTDPEFREFLLRVVSWADTGIKQVSVDRQRRDDDPAQLLGDVLTAMRHEPTYSIDSAYAETHVPEDGGVNELLLRLRHSDDASHPTFGIEDESDGTRRLLDLAPMLYLATKGPTVLVIDELDRSLHTLLAQRFVEMLIEHMPATTQLVFTTHDTNLLDCRVLRPDCIWFTEKGRSGATTLFSLAEFKAAQLEVLSKDLEKGYLQGRFGGIPFLGDAVALGWIPRKDDAK